MYSATQREIGAKAARKKKTPPSDHLESNHFPKSRHPYATLRGSLHPCTSLGSPRARGFVRSLFSPRGRGGGRGRGHVVPRWFPMSPWGAARRARASHRPRPEFVPTPAGAHRWLVVVFASARCPSTARDGTSTPSSSSTTRRVNSSPSCTTTARRRGSQCSTTPASSASIDPRTKRRVARQFTWLTPERVVAALTPRARARAPSSTRAHPERRRSHPSPPRPAPRRLLLLARRRFTDFCPRLPSSSSQQQRRRRRRRRRPKRRFLAWAPRPRTIGRSHTSTSSTIAVNTTRTRDVDRTGFRLTTRTVRNHLLEASSRFVPGRPSTRRAPAASTNEERERRLRAYVASVSAK